MTEIIYKYQKYFNYNLIRDHEDYLIIDRKVDDFLINDPAVEFFIKNPNKINWDWFSGNNHPAAVNFLINKHPDKINWYWFSENTNPAAVNFLIKNPDKIDWDGISGNTNPTAVNFLINKHPDKIRCNFSGNTNQAAVNYLINNPDKIDWAVFTRNPTPAAFEFIIEKYANKIDFKTVKYNPRLFDLDYQAMSLARVRIFEEELCHKAVLNPRRVKVWLDDFLERGGELKDFKYEPYSVSNF
jgi:hypothetical protein